MTQVKITDNGDLHFIFKEVDDDIVTTIKLDNGGEFEFYNDECVSLILPNFKQQLHYNIIDSVKLQDIKLQDYDVLFTVVINGQNINGKINISSLHEKI